MAESTGPGQGFTLIETLIAMALLAFIVADVGMVAVYASRSGGEARAVTGAVSLAENAIEHARSADFNRITMADSSLALCFTAARAAIACGDPNARIARECFSIALVQVACGGGDAHFTREREVVSLPEPLPDPLPDPLPAGPPLADAIGARIDVLVTWLDARGASQDFRLASIISRF